MSLIKAFATIYVIDQSVMISMVVGKIEPGTITGNKPVSVKGFVARNSFIMQRGLTPLPPDSTKGRVLGHYKKGDTTPILNQSTTGWYLTPKGWVSYNYVKLL